MMPETASVESASAPPAAVWEDFIDIFYEPSAVFDRRRNASPWPVLIALTVVVGLLFMAWQQALEPLIYLEMDRAMAESFADGSAMGAEQIEQMRTFGRAMAAIAATIAFPIGILIMSLLGWALVRAFGGTAGFIIPLLVVTYSEIVRIPQYLVDLLHPWLVDINQVDSTHDVSLSLARFLDQPETSGTLLALASRIDLFTLWATALIAIGLTVLTTLSRRRAWAVALVLWALATLPALIGGLVGG